MRVLQVSGAVVEAVQRHTVNPEVCQFQKQTLVFDLITAVPPDHSDQVATTTLPRESIVRKRMP
jgi:hypothetical protein